jgi:hypothetical protein|tara:strand:- start:573 stop:680 length:108 start_codon:yes stop_codon:yes gene_type:complete
MKSEMLPNLPVLEMVGRKDDLRSMTNCSIIWKIIK